jgi:hypothetical protein
MKAAEGKKQIKKIGENTHNQNFQQEATEATENPDSESGLSSPFAPFAVQILLWLRLAAIRQIQPFSIKPNRAQSSLIVQFFKSSHQALFLRLLSFFAANLNFEPQTLDSWDE